MTATSAEPHEHPPAVAHQFADYQQQRSAATLGMWTFLLTEVMLFGALFTMYSAYRFLHPAAFAEASRHLDLLLGTVNTVVLITSSLTVALAHQAAERQQRRAVIWLLALTLVLGGLFLGIKTVEYAHKFAEHHVPGSGFQWQAAIPEGETARTMELFFLLYFVITGLHALHVIVGLLLLGTAMTMAVVRSHVSPVLAEISGLYWHFVDVVWIFVFPLLYLIGLHQ